MNIEHIQSTEGNCLQQAPVGHGKKADALELTGNRRQVFHGIGGCFNEISWQLIDALPTDAKNHLLDEFFGEKGCGFNYGRVPVGANDFSLEWYSCDETPDDYALENFNIERDKRYTIPFVKEAMKRQKDFFVFASPWSPPTWMKTKRVYNSGTLRMEPKILDAYARYLLAFVNAYKQQGVDVRQIHVQNEPMADQKFPSCLWSGEDMRVFIGDYLGPALKKSGLETELWLGTINGPFSNMMIIEKSMATYYDQFCNTILSDDAAGRYISGIGLQWGGKNLLAQLNAAWPQLRIMQTESECGDGANSWEHMEYVFGLMWQYLRHNAERYTYWNFALEETGISTWGWKQNSLAIIDPEKGKVRYTPEFYLMKHVSRYVKSGARVLETQGPWAANSLAFENPDGTVVLAVCNGMHSARQFSFAGSGVEFSAEMQPHSLHTFILSNI